MKNNKKNKKRKNDLRHLSRKELIDLICDMRRPNPSKEAPTIEEAEKEQKKIKSSRGLSPDLPRYSCSADRCGSNLRACGDLVDAGPADLWFFHVTDSGAGADRNLSKEQTSENRRYCCILAGQQASGQTCDRRPWAVG